MSDNEIEALIEDLCRAKVTPEGVREAERAELLAELWGAFAELGLPGIGIEEEFGGSDGELGDVVTLLTVVGRRSVPLPLLENHLAMWAASRAGIEVDAEHRTPWTIAPGTDADSLRIDGDVGDGSGDPVRVSGTLDGVAWGGSAERVVAILDSDGVAAAVSDGRGPGSSSKLVLLDPADAEVRRGRDLAGQPRDTLTWSGVPATVVDSAIGVEALRQRGALLRAAQMAGAMDAVYELTRRYAATREQFGRPIGAFQAVQTHIVHLAEAAVLANTSVGRAAAALAAAEVAGEGGADGAADAASDAAFAVYAVKLLCDEYAATSIRCSHQAHGAIGMTREYGLQAATRRLNAWRGDWGTHRELGERLGAGVERMGGIMAFVNAGVTRREHRS